MEPIVIREIKPADNEELARVIRNVLIEMDVPKTGTAYADKSLDMMYETYLEDRSVYFVAERNGHIMGGAGVAPLAACDGNICELQKMYFLKEIRGTGTGTRMMQQCIEKAVEFGFDKCYLETMPNMLDAQKLYMRSGFEYIDAPLGNTGHSSCPVWMLKDLNNK